MFNRLHLHAALLAAFLLSASCAESSAPVTSPEEPPPPVTPPLDLTGAWRLASFDGTTVPGAYAVFLDEPVDGRIVERVEIRLDSASKTMLSGGLYQRRYCFSELHDAVVMYRYCWGDHGKFVTTVEDGTARRSLRMQSEYIQNLAADGEVLANGALSLREELWLQEAKRSTLWVRR